MIKCVFPRQILCSRDRNCVPKTNFAPPWHARVTSTSCLKLVFLQTLNIVFSKPSHSQKVISTFVTLWLPTEGRGSCPTWATRPRQRLPLEERVEWCEHRNTPARATHPPRCQRDAQAAPQKPGRPMPLRATHRPPLGGAPLNAATPILHRLSRESISNLHSHAAVPLSPFLNKQIQIIQRRDNTEDGYTKKK